MGDGKWLPMVRQLMVPIHHMRSLEGPLQNLVLHYKVPKVQGEASETLSFHFWDLDQTDEIFDRIVTK